MLYSLTEAQKQEALSELNRYYASEKLCREADVEECFYHYLCNFVPRPAFIFEVVDERIALQRSQL